MAAAGSKRVLALFWAYLAAEGEAFDARIGLLENGTIDVVSGVEWALMESAADHAEEGT